MYFLWRGDARVAPPCARAPPLCVCGDVLPRSPALQLVVWSLGEFCRGVGVVVDLLTDALLFTYKEFYNKAPDLSLSL